MNTRSLLMWLAAAALVLAAALSAGAQRGQAAGAGQSPLLKRMAIQPIAFSLGVSPATGHLFVLSTDIGPAANNAPGKSWVSMLDARSYRVLRVISVDPGARTVAVNDKAGLVFVVSGYGPETASKTIKTAVTVLDTKTGNTVRHVNCGQGMLTRVNLATGMARLFVITRQGAQDSPSFTLHVLNSTTGKHLWEMGLPGNITAGAVHERTGRIFVGDTSGVVNMYDARTWKWVSSINVDSTPSLIVPDEVYNRVLILSGEQQNILTVADARSGKHLKTTWIEGTPVTSIVLDKATNRIFATSIGKWSGSHMVTDGSVAILNRQTYQTLRTVTVGSVPGRALLDPSTHHLFVLSMAHVMATGGWMGSSLVSVLDTRSGALEAEIRLPATDVLDLAELVLDAKNSRLYVTATGLGYSMVFGGNSMTALDTHTGVILSNVDVPSTPPA